MNWDHLVRGVILDAATGAAWDPARLQSETMLRRGRLAKLGIKRHSRVAIAHGGTAAFFADLFATWSLGATAICLDPELTPPELETVLSFAKCDVALSSEPRSGTIGGARLVCLTDCEMVPAGQFPAPSGSLDDPALILFTSGTTGEPKGVVLSHRALLARVALNIEVIGRRKLARTLVTLPMHFGHGLIGNALTPLAAGGDLILHPRGLSMARDIADLIDEHRVTFLSSVPAFWRSVQKLSKPPKGKSLLRVHVGSAPLSATAWSDIADWTRCDVANCYGITENANWIGGAVCNRSEMRDGLVGRLWGGIAAIMTDSGDLAFEGTGEILIQTPSLMTGYLDRDGATNEAFVNGYYRTGDVGQIDASGNITLTGRKKEEINRAGFKVQPAEIDFLLECHPSVAEACTMAMPDPACGEAVASAIRLEAGAIETAKELRRWCRERIRKECVPEHWFFLEEIPRNARGKVNRALVLRHVLKKQE